MAWYKKQTAENLVSIINNLEYTNFIYQQKPSTKAASRYSTVKLYQIKEKGYVADKNMVQLRLLNSDIYDMQYTIAIIMSTEKYCDFRQWKIRHDQCGYTLNLPYTDFRRIQKGFTTDYMNTYSLSKKNPVLPWVIRAIVDEDTIIFSKGIKNLFHQLVNKNLTGDVTYPMLQRWKRIGHLFSKFDWKDKALQDNGFLKGLATFLQPGDQNITIDPTIFHVMKNTNCPIPRKKINKINQSQLNHYYQWLQEQNPDIILKVFCNIHGSHTLKTNKKRKLKR